MEPTNLATRDLYYGPWGRDDAPDPNAVYTLVERKHTGVNLGLTVTDPKGREWSVKQPYPGNVDSRGPGRSRAVASTLGGRLPPAAGLLPAGVHLKDDFGTRTEVGGRFRLKHEALKDDGVLAVGARTPSSVPGPIRASS